MTTVKKTARLKANTPIPERHLRMAEYLFAPVNNDPDFDYYPLLEGYEIEYVDACKSRLVKKTYAEGLNDPRPDGGWGQVFS